MLTWDADAEPDARSFFVNQATAEGIGHGLTDEAARLLGGKGEFAIITGALSAANQNEWISFIKKRVAERHPNLKLATIRPSDDDRDKAFAETQTILRAFPNVKLVMAISAPAVPGAGEAVRQARRPDVKVIGLSLPNMNKPYVHEGVVQTVMLWNTADLGYLTVYAGALMAQNKLAPGATSVEAGPAGQDRDSRQRSDPRAAAAVHEGEHRQVRFLRCCGGDPRFSRARRACPARISSAVRAARRRRVVRYLARARGLIGVLREARARPPARGGGVARGCLAKR